MGSQKEYRRAPQLSLKHVVVIDGAALLHLQPRVDAIVVKHVLAGQARYHLTILQELHANDALVSLVFLLLGR